MKLRVKGNSLRLRLTRGEVARIGAGESVDETIEFGAGDDARLTYTLTTSADADRIAAAYEFARITVTLPADQAREWSATELVSLRGEQTLTNDALSGMARKLVLLIEKDFACVSPDTNEDQTDAYPNPNTTC